MNGLFNTKNYHLYSFLHLFIIFGQIHLSFSQLLNNIIRLGENNLRYNHINFNEKGDMIIDVSAFPVTQERKFFGLKKNGRFYFNDTNNKETPFYTKIVDHTEGRLEGESFFIKMTSNNNNFHGKELLFGISKNEDYNPVYYTEVYNLNEKNMTKYLTNDIFGNLISNCFSISEMPNQLNSNYYYYIFSYIVFISDSCYFNIKKIYFSFELDKGCESISKEYMEVAYQRIVSCFFTEKSLYICFYLNINKKLRIKVYDSDFSRSVETSFYDPSSYQSDIFFKGIHFKGEIGFFIYFKENNNYPTFSILQCKDDKSMTTYLNYDNIDINKYTFNTDHLLNDINILNNFQICYIAPTYEKSYFQIIIITLYKSDSLMNIRYYKIEMWTTYKTKIFLDIKSALYKNYISLAFSHCSQIYCSDPHSDGHNSSLIIFSYPNSTDFSLDIIPLLLATNKKIENDLSFNLEGSINIENNLFGYIFKGTIIMNYPTGLNFLNITNGNIINIESIILKNENISLSFETHNNYTKKDYVFKYAYVIEEPDYDDTENFIDDIDETYGNNIENEKNYYKKFEYIGRTSYFTLKISEDLITDCNDESCELCFTNYTCVTCAYEYTFNNNNKSCLQKNINLGECSTKEIIEGKCKNKNINNDKIKEIYDLLKRRISSNSNEFIETKNAIFQMTSLEMQEKINNSNISSIDLRECENIIKIEEGLSENDSLLILKLDIKNDDLSSTYVQYEIYNPKTLDVIPLDICLAISILINSPLSLDENIKTMYNNLNQSGYNLFNLNDSFYNDICSTYTTENGTDLILIDRKNIIFDSIGNVSICQKGCTFNFLNLTTNKVGCNCVLQKEEIITNISNIEFYKNLLVDNFFKPLKNSNFLLLRCFKLVFSKGGQKNNIGSYIISVLVLIFIVLMTFYSFKDNKKINNFIQEILNQILTNKKVKKRKIKIENKNNIKQSKNQKELIKQKELKKQKKTETEKKVENFPPKKVSPNLINNINIKNSNINLTIFHNKPNEGKESLNSNNYILREKKIKKAQNNKYKKNSNSKEQINKKANMKFSNKYLFYYKNQKLTDEELNNLSYEVAKILDKRTFFQYYYSLIKKKQLILFAFFPAHDYNLITIKISLLLLSFSLYFTINGFFFSDSTMNKINQDKGTYNIIYQIPIIVYSILITAMINFMLKSLSISSGPILKIKLGKNFIQCQKLSNDTEKFLKIKIAIFFIFSFLLMIFFWYYISCFCAVYKNTQMILIKDTLISFGLSMIYPFGLCLLPGFLRIPALKSKENNKKYLYKVSLLISMI